MNYTPKHYHYQIKFYNKNFSTSTRSVCYAKGSARDLSEAERYYWLIPFLRPLCMMNTYGGRRVEFFTTIEAFLSFIILLILASTRYL